MQTRAPRDESDFTAEEIAALAAMDMDDEDLRRATLTKEMNEFEEQLRNWRPTAQLVPSEGNDAPEELDEEDTNNQSDDDETKSKTETNIGDAAEVNGGGVAASSPKKRGMKKKGAAGTTRGPKRAEGGACHTTRKATTSRTVQPAPPPPTAPAALLRMPAAMPQRGPLRGAQRRPFSFQDVVKAVLTPEDRVGGSDAVAEALAQVKIAELQDVNLDSSSLLELLGNVTHVYLQHNRLTELSGLEIGINLTVIIVHHNQLTSLGDIAALPNVAVLDASYNLIRDLDPSDLPSEQLRSLNLRGNECSPSYKKHDPQDEAYVAEYRTALLSVCVKLSVLDDVEVTDAMREGLGLTCGVGQPLLLEMVRADEEAQQLVAVEEQESGLQTRVTDEDFLLGRNNNSSSPGSGDPDVGDDDVGGDADDVRRTRPASKSATPPPTLPGHGGDDGPSSEEEADVSTQQRTDAKHHHAANDHQQHVSLTDRLLGQYERHSQQHVALLDEAVNHSNTLLAGVRERVADGTMAERFDPQRKPVEDDEEEDAFAKRRNRVRQDDADGVRTRASRPPGSDGKAMQDLSDVTQTQTLIRNELRKAMQHHSDVAQMMISDHWHDAKESLRERHLKAQERRYELRERLARPSAAYAEALTTLSKECGDDLGRYRLDADTFAKDLISKKGSSAPQVAVVQKPT